MKAEFYDLDSLSIKPSGNESTIEKKVFENFVRMRNDKTKKLIIVSSTSSGNGTRQFTIKWVDINLYGEGKPNEQP